MVLGLDIASGKLQSQDDDAKKTREPDIAVEGGIGDARGDELSESMVIKLLRAIGCRRSCV